MVEVEVEVEVDVDVEDIEVNTGKIYRINVYNLYYQLRYPWFLHQCMYKKCCGVIGSGTKVGCIIPGNNYDECIFASV